MKSEYILPDHGVSCVGSAENLHFRRHVFYIMSITTASQLNRQIRVLLGTYQFLLVWPCGIFCFTRIMISLLPSFLCIIHPSFTSFCLSHYSFSQYSTWPFSASRIPVLCMSHFEKGVFVLISLIVCVLGKGCLSLNFLITN